MKQIILLIAAVAFFSTGLLAQSAPEGLHFQAIARNLDGKLLQNKRLNVQVELFTAGDQEKVYYTEKHSVKSNATGILNFVIGEGNVADGKFADIPWTDEQMWVRISVKLPSDRDYQIISAGQLFAVPYALYAEQAGELKSPNQGRNPNIGMNSINWTLNGNYNSQNRNDGKPVLGTVDANDLVYITNNTPRMIIDKDGNITLLVDLDINGNLNVDGNTTLQGTLTVANMASTHFSGTLTVDLVTVLNSQLRVENMASTHLTGSLDVDKTMNVDGASTLNSTLDVTGMSATTLQGKLNVTQSTTLQDDLTVGMQAPTHLTGTLTVDQDVNAGTITVNNNFLVDGQNPSHMTGTLTVDKLATLDKGLVVNGGGVVGPGNSYLAYFNNTEGGTSDGIAIKLKNEDIDKENNYMTFYKGANGIAGRIEGYNVGDIADVPLPSSDEIWSAVCVGIADYNPLTIYWTQFANKFNLFANAWNDMTIPSFDIPDIPAFTIPNVPALTIPDVPAFVIPDVPAFVIPDIPGVVIPDVPEITLGPYLCVDIEVCFCFCDDLSWDCCCVDEEVCLIPEFTLFPGITLPDFPGIPIPDFPGIPIPDFPGIPIPDFPGIEIPDFPGLVIPATPEINFKELFGECPTIPTFSDILVQEGVCPDEDIFDLQDGYIRRLMDWAYEHRLHGLIGADPLKLASNALTWGLTTAVMHNGVVYGSKGADYAEYLPKMYASEQFLKGEVVGVHNGVISKNTTNADQILAITSQPLVLGNMQEDGNMNNYEKVAFLGQIPVFVNGPVSLGDYIVASGKNDGTGKAIHPDNMTTDMLPKVIGVAWSAYEGEGVTLINTSIGLRPAEISTALRRQAEVENSLQQKITVQRNGSDELSRDIEELKRAIYNP